ncbi:MAG TPA: hypothetical protein VF806_08685 [Anaerolineaceae bacterium]
MTGPVETRLNFAHMVVQRLERLSADSAWAHISSGYRGSLIKIIDRLERLPDLETTSPEDVSLLDFLINKGLDLLAKAAREIGDPELLRFASQPRPH